MVDRCLVSLKSPFRPVHSGMDGSWGVGLGFAALRDIMGCGDSLDGRTCHCADRDTACL